ncbi:MAG: hypothetical protein WAN30_02710 [Acidimicrobiales bacterium]
MSGRFAGLIAALVAVLALSSTAAVTFAGFSAQIVNNANTFSSGTMQLEESNGGTTCYSTGSGSGGTVSGNSANCSINKLVGTLNQVPGGTPLSTTITMTNNGTIGASLDSLVFSTCSAATASNANGYVGSDTSGFCGKVDIEVSVGSTTAGTHCLIPASTSACAGTPTSAATLASVSGTTINQSTSPQGLTLLSAGANQAYTFTVLLDSSATNLDQGLTASQTMTWNQS